LFGGKTLVGHELLRKVCSKMKQSAEASELNWTPWDDNVWPNVAIKQKHKTNIVARWVRPKLKINILRLSWPYRDQTTLITLKVSENGMTNKRTRTLTHLGILSTKRFTFRFFFLISFCHQYQIFEGAIAFIRHLQQSLRASFSDSNWQGECEVALLNVDLTTQLNILNLDKRIGLFRPPWTQPKQVWDRQFSNAFRHVIVLFGGWGLCATPRILQYLLQMRLTLKVHYSRRMFCVSSCTCTALYVLTSLWIHRNYRPDRPVCQHIRQRSTVWTN
jgi:hypothetical protein